MDQFNNGTFPFITESVAEVDELAVFGTEYVFFGLPTKRKEWRRGLKSIRKKILRANVD